MREARSDATPKTGRLLFRDSDGTLVDMFTPVSAEALARQRG